MPRAGFSNGIGPAAGRRMANFLYDYWPIVDRPPLCWPDGKRLAVYVALNIEHFEPGRPSTAITPLTAGLPVDPLNAGWRDYGLRVGIWRMIELLDRHELRASALVNSEVLERYPQIVRAGLERGWSWVAHGVSNSRLWTGLELDEERVALTEVADELRRHTGRAADGLARAGADRDRPHLRAPRRARASRTRSTGAPMTSLSRSAPAPGAASSRCRTRSRSTTSPSCSRSAPPAPSSAS